MKKQSVGYVDGFVFVVPKKNLAAYKKMASDGGKVWMKNGALSYKECMIDDAHPQHAILTFPKLTKKKPSETVWFSYIEYRSKSHRDQVNAKVMKDPMMDPYNPKNKGMAMPFDEKRMAYGGFKVIVNA
ncbi:MAG: DUF1428 domain-containing protein [bacterium]|nr:DUF1428 domain-containing protein [bacterium]